MPPRSDRCDEFQKLCMYICICVLVLSILHMFLQFFCWILELFRQYGWYFFVFHVLNKQYVIKEHHWLLELSIKQSLVYNYSHLYFIDLHTIPAVRDGADWPRTVFFIFIRLVGSSNAFKSTKEQICLNIMKKT